jgi:amidase
VAVAKALGIHLGPDEAVLYRKYLVEQLKDLDAFVQARLPEPRPPMASATREPGHRPGPDEDPLNAWTWKCRIEGAARGVLAGKTVSYKDHIAVAGMPMSFGSFALDGFIPDFDATVVTRVLRAGGTVIGKNVMNGLSGGYGTGGAIGDYGRPLNPHNHEHVTGGSSSGSGAAVAAREVDISFGGDQGGSIRIPAAFCGIVGHKPTFGLVSHFGIGFGSDQSIDYTGPMARTVEDAARAFEATAGPDPYDPRQTREVPTRVDVLGRLGDGVTWPRSTSSPARALSCPRSRFPRTMPCARPRRRSRAKGRWRCSRRASSAPSPGRTTRRPSSPPSTSCGLPRPMCSRPEPSCRSLSPS